MKITGIKIEGKEPVEAKATVNVPQGNIDAVFGIGGDTLT